METHETALPNQIPTPSRDHWIWRQGDGLVGHFPEQVSVPEG